MPLNRIAIAEPQREHMILRNFDMCKLFFYEIIVKRRDICNATQSNWVNRRIPKRAYTKYATLTCVSQLRTFFCEMIIKRGDISENKYCEWKI